MSLITPVRRRQPVLVAAVLICAASMLGLGAWAFLAPHSFADFIDYPPYNRHLIHDAGTFQLGIGVTTLLALLWPDGLLAALTGFAVASALHTVSHWTEASAAAAATCPRSPCSPSSPWSPSTSACERGSHEGHGRRGQGRVRLAAGVPHLPRRHQGHQGGAMAIPRTVGAGTRSA